LEESRLFLIALQGFSARGKLLTEEQIMNTSRCVRWICGLACIAAAAPARAEGWSFPNLNPFKTEKKEVSPYVPATRDWSAAEAEDPPTSGFRLPKMKLPSMGGASQKPSSDPSMMQRFGQGTKNFFSKTADVLTPWDNDKKPLPSTRSTGVRRVYPGSPNAVQEEKKSFFSSLFSSDDEPEKPRTVNGFLGQPRPKY
jgi:hypothetical protein